MPKETLFKQLLQDLESKTKLCFLTLTDYPGVTLELLNKYLKERGPLESLQFGLLAHFYVENGKLVPCRMTTIGNQTAAAKISSLLCSWIKWNPQYGGEGLLSKGKYIRSKTGDVRFPDICYIPRKSINRFLPHAPQLMYEGEPFCPSFVVEIDTLARERSQLEHLDHKMRNEYFAHGIELGWLIDPEHGIMIEYKNCACQGGVYASTDNSWRDLFGGDILPGFRLQAIQLDMVLSPDSCLSCEEKFAEPIICPACGHQSITWSQNTMHSEWHRFEGEKRRYLQHQKQRKERARKKKN